MMRKEVKIEAEKIRSSYKDNEYGPFLYSLIKVIKPKIVVEFGVLDGYSTIHIAEALRSLRCNPSKQYFFAYDLWDEYQYNHGNLKDVQCRIDKLGLSDCVLLMNGDILKSHTNFNDNTINLLHVDVSNDGAIIKQVMELWDRKICKDGMIIFEGGSEERDDIEWMQKYNKERINSELYKNRIIATKYDMLILPPFPSITLMRKI